MLLTAAAAIAATVALTTTPALASTSASTLHPATATAYGAGGPAAAPAVTCNPWVSPSGAFLGTPYCPSDGVAVYFDNGTMEEFIVGTSHAVWTAWGNDDGNGWDETSLGGAAYYQSNGTGYPAVWLVSQSSDGWGLTIGTTNASGQHRCDNRHDSPSGSWTGWFNC